MKIRWQRHYHNVYRSGLPAIDIPAGEDAFWKEKIFCAVVVRIAGLMPNGRRIPGNLQRYREKYQPVLSRSAA
jgi:hypothetical protein